MSFRTLCLGPVLGLTAVLSSVTAAAADLPASEEKARLMGSFISGSYALNLNDPQAQSRFFQEAFEIASDDVRIGRLALYSALFADDRDRAVETAKALLRADGMESMGRAVMAVDAFAKGRASRVKRYASAPTRDQTMGPVMKIVLGWSLVDEGKYEDARDQFRALGTGSYFNALGKLQLAKLEGRLGNVEEATTAFDNLEGLGLSELEILLARTRFEARNGLEDEALDRLEGYLSMESAGEIGPAGTYAERLREGKRLPKLSVRAEAARALTMPAFSFFVRVGASQGAETFLRLSRWIDPDYDLSAIWLAGLLDQVNEEMSDATREEVLELYATVEPTSPYYVNARLGKANQLFDQELDDRALVVLESLAESHPHYVTRETLGRARFFREQWAAALPFYDDLISSLTDSELEANPEPLRLRGIIYERLGRWHEAEADFQRVLRYEPDDSNTLNYLGYTWVDRGENLEEAFELIEKAVAIEPDSGAITDSLGWAHYKLGRYEDAVEYLERAVVLTPYSATIIDHLGDVYWRLGRKREATYQWVRALEYDPTDEERAAIQTKLDAGADAEPAS